jgi:hypothetical protein
VGTVSYSPGIAFAGRIYVSCSGSEELCTEISPDKIYNGLERPIASLKIDQSILDSAVNQPVPHQVEYSTEKSERILGVKYRPIDITIQDTLRFAVALGWQ